MLAWPSKHGRVVDQKSIGAADAASSSQRWNEQLDHAFALVPERGERLEATVTLRRGGRIVGLEQLEHALRQCRVVRWPGGVPIERELLDPRLTGLAVAWLKGPPAT